MQRGMTMNIEEMLEKAAIPWTLLDSLESDERYIRIKDSKGRTVVWCDSGVPSDDDAAVFALIVRAVNEYEDLRDAGKILIKHPEGCRCPNNGGGDCEWCEAAEQMSLALAEKGE